MDDSLARLPTAMLVVNHNRIMPEAAPRLVLDPLGRSLDNQ